MTNEMMYRGLIADFFSDEYGFGYDESDFENPELVSLAYTSDGDDRYYVYTFADIVNRQFAYEIQTEDKIYSFRTPSYTERDFAEELYQMTFDDLINAAVSYLPSEMQTDFYGCD